MEAEEERLVRLHHARRRESLIQLVCSAVIFACMLVIALSSVWGAQ